MYAARTMCSDINGIASLKITPHGSTSATLPAASSVNPSGEFNPRIRRHHRHTSQDPGEHNWHTGPKMSPRLQTSPAVNIDRNENRLSKEEQPFERKRDTENLSPLRHKIRPQQTKLKPTNIVPVAAPTANVTAMYFDHRCANSIASASFFPNSPVVRNQCHRSPRDP